MGLNELPKQHDPIGMSTEEKILELQSQQEEEAYFSTLGSVPLEQVQPQIIQSTQPLANQQPSQHLIYPSTTLTNNTAFAYASSNVIRFASKRERHQQQQQQGQADSFENFDFNSLPTTTSGPSNQQHYDRSRTNNITDEATLSHEQPIPHSSGMTTVSNMTSDDSATLIGRSNNIHHHHHHPMQQLHHLETTQEYTTTITTSSSPLPSNPLSRPTSPHHLYQPASPTSLQEQHHHYPMKTPSPIITNNLDLSSHHNHQQQQHNLHVPIMDNPRLTMDSTRQKKLVRNYKLFPGRNKFFCGGRFMTSREYWAFILALVLLIAPSILFGVFT